MLPETARRLDAAPKGHSPEALAAQSAILSAHARAWGAQTLARIAETRPDAAIVVTTSAPGLAAWEAMIHGLPAAIHERVAPTSELDYRAWCMRSADEAHDLHVVVWSWIKAPLPRQRRHDFPLHPIAESADYWVHRYGQAGAGLDAHAADLYAWDGDLAKLLSSGISERFHPRG